MTSRKNWEQDGGIQGIIPDFGQIYYLFWVSFFSFINCFSVASEMKSSKVLKKKGATTSYSVTNFIRKKTWKNRPECHPFKSSFRELKQTLATIFRLAMTNRSPALIFRVLLTIHDIAPLNHTKSEHTEDRGLLLVHNYAAKWFGIPSGFGLHQLEVALCCLQVSKLKNTQKQGSRLMYVRSNQLRHQVFWCQ